MARSWGIEVFYIKSVNNMLVVVAQFSYGFHCYFPPHLLFYKSHLTLKRCNLKSLSVKYNKKYYHSVWVLCCTKYINLHNTFAKESIESNKISLLLLYVKRSYIMMCDVHKIAFTFLMSKMYAVWKVLLEVKFLNGGIKIGLHKKR